MTALPLLTLFALWAAPAQTPVTVRSDRPLWRTGQEWRVQPRPLVDIGEVEGDPEYELSDVIGVLRLTDGRIAVANMGSSEIRFYDRTGKFIKAAGRKGGGPGEFRQIMGLRRGVNDTIIADDRHERVLFFTAAGNYAREQRVSSQLSGVAGWFSDGTRVGFNGISIPSRDRTGEWVDSTEFALYDARGEKIVSFGRLPVQAMVGPVSTTIEFAPRLAVAVHNDRFFYNYPDDYEIDVYDRSGRLVRRIRRAWSPVAVEKSDLERYRDSFVNAPGESGQRSERLKQFHERRFTQMVFAKTFAAHGQMMFDRAGNLWVRETERPTGEPMSNRLTPGRHPVEWSVFDLQGRWLGQVKTPARFVVFDIGADYIAGKALDDLDVEHVRVYALTKPR